LEHVGKVATNRYVSVVDNVTMMNGWGQMNYPKFFKIYRGIQGLFMSFRLTKNKSKVAMPSIHAFMNPQCWINAVVEKMSW
jgi:hypothetical protein